MVIFLGNTNSGDQNFLNPLIYHRDTSHYMVLKLFGDIPSGKFASFLSNVPVLKKPPRVTIKVKLKNCGVVLSSLREGFQMTKNKNKSDFT